MPLVVDTTVLVGERFRVKGRERIADERLDLFLPEEMWDETRVELPRRVQAFALKHRLTAGLADQLIRVCPEAVDANVAVVDRPVYVAIEDDARARSLRDPNDWPLVACAMLLDAGVWTNDNDLLGTGVPTWTTQTLQNWLDRNPQT